jgi:hypothetical protein
MPPFLVALIAAGIIWLIPRKNKVPGSPTIVQTTPSTSPPGITTGFAAPPIQNYTPTPSQPTAPPLQTNQPGTSSSGVPEWTSNAQEFNDGLYSPAPSPGTRIPGFYAGPLSANLAPRYKPTKAPKTKQPCSGCGGSCGGNCQNPSDCSVASNRNKDGGCLSPTQGALLNSAPPDVISSWAANLVSASVSPFQAHQQFAFDQQDTNPQESDVTLPASPFIQGIGLQKGQPIRSALA